MGDGQKVALGLGSLGRALAPNPAGTDGDLRLQQLVAGSPGVVVGVDEAGQAGLLVGLEQLAAGPHSGHQCQPACAQNQRLAEVDSTQEQACNQDGHVGERGAQVGLLDDQQHGNAHQGKCLQDLFPGEAAPAQVGEITRHGDDQHQLDPLGGLKVHRPEFDPAARAQNLLAHRQHRNQRHQADSVGPGNVIDQLVVVDLGKDEHRRQPANDPVDLLGMEAGVFGVQRGRVNLKDRNRAQHEHHGEQRPIEIAKAEEAAHRIYCPFPELMGGAGGADAFGPGLNLA